MLLLLGKLNPCIGESEASIARRLISPVSKLLVLWLVSWYRSISTIGIWFLISIDLISIGIAIIIN